MLTILAQLKDENLISELNYQFAKMIDKQQKNYHYSPQQQNLAILLSALMSFTVMQGNSCLRLDSNFARNPFELSEKYAHLSELIQQKIEHIQPLAWPNLLQNHIAFSQSPERIAPMLFQADRLYFYRYWQGENRIAHYLQQAVSNEPNFANIPLHQQILDQFFTHDNEHEIDWQKIAVATALQQKMSIISGGPGTGKTRTVAILLMALQLKQQMLNLPPLKIALVAPTGKAAARLKESISANLLQLPNAERLKNEIPLQASTIHRLIGITPNKDKPRYHTGNPLHLDLIVVDEASMIDLFVMEKLFNALKPSTRLIILGDKDQLASVEAGNIMGELGKFLTYGYSQTHCDYLMQTTGYTLYPTHSNPPAICDSLCHLRKSYRFNDQSGIGQLASEINGQQAMLSWQLFANNDYDDIDLIQYPSPMEFAEPQQYQQYCVNLVIKHAVELYRDYLLLAKQREQDPLSVSVSEIFSAFQKVRFLSALRVGELGVERLNQAIATALQQAGLVHFRNSRENYVGKPILITENTPLLHIFSGDIGIVLSDEQGKLRVYFDMEQNEKLLSITPSRLPSNEPAYVMTVHKSQGSEFEHSLLITPLTTMPIVTKELLYTAVTRAKKRFTLFSHEKVWKQGVKNEVQRQSGLMEQILMLDENT